MNDNHLSPHPLPKNHNEDEIDLADCLNVVWRYRWIIVLTTTFCVIMAFVYIHQKTPLYRITAQLSPKIIGSDIDGKPYTNLSAYDIVAWFTGGAYQELTIVDVKRPPVINAKVISKSKIVKIFSVVGNRDEGLKYFKELMESILHGNVRFLLLLLTLLILSSSQTGYFSGLICIMFDRGREYKRGQSPLSHQLPSLAFSICGFLPMLLAGEGAGVRYAGINH